MTASPAPAEASRVNQHFPGFDGLRAIAAIAVFLTHAAFVAGANPNHALGVFFARMNAGVAVFFLISGFLLYRPFVAARFDDRPAPMFGPYLARRLLRIYPAYWIALTIIVFVLRAAPYQGEMSPAPSEWFDSIGATVSYYLLVNIYRLDTVFGPLTQSWTLSTELAFYVFLPGWAWLVHRLARRATEPMARLRTEIAGLVVLVTASAAWKVFVLGTVSTAQRRGQLKTWLPWWLDLFALGMLLAIVSVWLVATRRPAPFGLEHRYAPAACWLGAAASFWFVSTQLDLPTMAIRYSSGWQEAAEHYLYGLTALLLVLPAVLGPPGEGGVRRFLTSRVMVFLGTVSYGIYLWHEAWLDRYIEWTNQAIFTVYTGDTPFDLGTSNLWSAPFVTMIVIVFAVTVASATASWYGAERPILRWKPARR